MNKSLNYWLRSGIFAIFISLLLSCETEIDLLSDDGDTTIIFALIDPSADVQLIKVNKSFIGEENAAVLAQDPNNFNYAEDELTVELIGYRNGEQVQAILATYTVDKYTKDDQQLDGSDAFFAQNGNVVYEVETSGDNAIETDYRYEVRVTNNSTNEVTSAETEIVDAFFAQSVTSPSNTNLKFALGSGVYDQMSFEWLAPTDGSIFELYLNIYYRDVSLASPVDTSEVKKIELFLGQTSISETTSFRKANLFFDTEIYFKRLNEEFGKDKSRKYLLEPMELRFVIGGDEMNTYVEVNQPSEGIVQEKPEYTNVKNGLGIVSTRREVVFSGFYLENNITARELRDGLYTRGSGITVCHAERNLAPGSYTCPN